MTWKDFIESENQQPYFKSLKEFVEYEYQTQTVFPPRELIYNAFRWCKFEDTKVIILGQDPYHGYGQAHGLSFSVNDGIAFPPSLRNILQEVHQDVGSPIPNSGNLTRWAKQGVLLLNDVLTVRQASPGSHQKRGWEDFTENAIRQLSSEKENLVFLLWGRHAQQKGKVIDSNKHLVLTSGHPSPMSANRGLWFGNRHFSQTNTYLMANGKTSVIW
ncbi:uracil-DNA glycosylase [Avrilella dinanensis]|uniref:Uracil-DNA glycosylase n=1 Tax=Avrilella dinanensis TaxID=2008672 RepID=A0A2M9R6B2_9FLAO|nr:uracil-DNA glycosylase [Avrilella dinanensis]PJR04389.1 uracil-DNA glycosylase [Avrilella dinanensis]